MSSPKERLALIASSKARVNANHRAVNRKLGAKPGTGSAGRGRPWTKAEIRELHQPGLSVAEIADKLGRSYNSGAAKRSEVVPSYLLRAWRRKP